MSKQTSTATRTPTEPAAGGGTQAPIEPTKPAEAPPAVDVDECNTGGCRKPELVDGLCGGHWASRRGDANPRTTEGPDE